MDTTSGINNGNLVNIMHSKDCPGPVLGLTTISGIANIAAQIRRHDPDFKFVVITFPGPRTHANRMDLMKTAVETATRMIGRPRRYEEFNPEVISRASEAWPDDNGNGNNNNNTTGAVLFAATHGDRTRYPVFLELDRKKDDLARKEHIVASMKRVHGIEDNEELNAVPGIREWIVGCVRIQEAEIDELKEDIAYLEENAEFIAFGHWVTNCDRMHTQVDYVRVE